MSKARYLFAGALIALGCESETFDLLPEKGPEGGDAGETAAAGTTSGMGGGGKGGSASGGRPPTSGTTGAGSGSDCVGGTCCNGPCPECRDDTDCALGPYKKCRELPEFDFVKRCVDCMLRNDCGIDEVCDPFHVCVPRCPDVTECVFPRPVCDIALGLCVRCTEDDHCDGAQHCMRGQCVQCVENAHCGFGLVCGPELVCRPCVYTSECGGFGRDCVEGRCVDPMSSP